MATPTRLVGFCFLFKLLPCIWALILFGSEDNVTRARGLGAGISIPCQSHPEREAEGAGRRNHTCALRSL